MKNRNILQCKGNDSKWINCRDGKVCLFFIVRCEYSLFKGGFVQIQTGTFDQVGERSQFDSPVLDALSEEGCVQFQYNIAGTDNDWLNVYVEDYWSGRVSCMWHKNGSTVPDRWTTGEAPLRLEQDGKYQVRLECMLMNACHLTM
jgi:hypothetical protein